MTRARLLITRTLPDAALDLARERFDVTLWPHDEPIGDALMTYVQSSDAVLVMATDRLDRVRLRAMSSHVQALATYSVGYDHIDLEAATEFGLPVFYTPDVLSDAVAETALLLILSAARDASTAETILRAGEWGPWSPTRFLGKELTGRRLGLFGMGRIGLAVARRAQAFGMRIHYHNRSRHPEDAGITYHPSLDSLLGISDVLCVCAPSTEQTRGALNADRIALLPEGAVFVNIARGDLVDEAALMDAIESGRIASAGLDVYCNEPHIDRRFLTLPRTTLLPHVGSATYEARLAMGRLAIEALEQWLYVGKTSANCLNPSVPTPKVHFGSDL
ncbi:D-glycerate dehydrogenase [Burkholderia sp. Ac-20353]|uniref:2-hydroxyacid dehydrogenase n=1 Tax=Burkholderia sp. Ac-20353 TaxID=2703894 RepID=UPI00197BEC4C|nr:D-glycerate dehydrogenase [Burkholderia sp. Ac-20353]MBN3785529.1 D-glycerate dehydrogenase [Burkholderia sp. Ac-20353]